MKYKTFQRPSSCCIVPNMCRLSCHVKVEVLISEWIYSIVKSILWLSRVNKPCMFKKKNLFKTSPYPAMCPAKTPHVVKPLGYVFGMHSLSFVQ